ncbi:ABC transporter substrate-binding protein [Muricoccus radiodurans]|uniref:ABC transporter substrate-binding protein n=1 Tax=Muricoccus radiodurans TaxID=2231721 RepID=UPI003CEF76E5
MGSIGRRAALLAGGAALASPALAQGSGASVLRFVPHANLSSLDPLQSGTLIATNFANMVHDQLFALDRALVPRHQMLAGHVVSDDRLTWTLTLREGLRFHDGEPVRGADAVASIRRWMGRDPFGRQIATRLDAIRAPDDRTIEIRLSRPFALLPFALGNSTCFIMPERAARAEPTVAVTEHVGCGPFRFVREEWDSGSRAVFLRNDRYVSRQEAPDGWSGGKPVNLERIEWHIMPDPATAAAALQRGEVDWLERPLLDLLPRLRALRDVRLETIEGLGFYAYITFNTQIAPFDNPALRRALIPAVDQREFMSALIGDQAEFAKAGVGFFHPASPYASDEGMAALTGPRDLDLARRLVRESGYDGRPIAQMIPSDLPAPNALGQVAHALMRSIGLNVDAQVADWGSVISRYRATGEAATRNPWQAFSLAYSGLWTTNPGMHQPLYANEFPHPEMERLRDAWFDAPDEAAQKAIARRMQALAFEHPPFIPLGTYFVPHAYRTRLSGIVPAPSTVFWNVRKAA